MHLDSALFEMQPGRGALGVVEFVLAAQLPEFVGGERLSAEEKVAEEKVSGWNGTAAVLGLLRGVSRSLEAHKVFAEAPVR